MSEYTDFLIVGGGISGLNLQYELDRRGASSICIDQSKANVSTNIAAGIVNPIAGKFFALSWRANDFFPGLDTYYGKLEEWCSTSFFHNRDLIRVFASAGEQNIWLSKANQARYASYCSFDPAGIHELHSPYGVLKINGGGYLDTTTFLQSLRNYMNSKQKILDAEFDHAKLDIQSKRYENIEFGAIIFCEGYRVVHNPYFNFLPFTPNKGELLEIHAPDLGLEAIAVGGTFVLPIGNERYKVGATYEHQFLDMLPTEKNREYLLEKLDKMMTVKYEVVDQWAGIRPAVKDRRPILGRHPLHKDLYLFNGLGSKGVSMAPQLAFELASYIIDDQGLDPSCDIQRYYDLA